MKPTNPLWYLTALLIALGSWMIATVVAAGAWDPVRAATVTSVSERADAGGKSLAVYTDLLQKGRPISCRATSPGNPAIDIPAETIDITADDDGTTWHLIGMLRTGSDNLRIRCSPRDRGADNATYAYAAVNGYESKVNTGKGIAILGSTAGGALAVFTYYTRRRRRADLALEGSSR